MGARSESLDVDQTFGFDPRYFEIDKITEETFCNQPGSDLERAENSCWTALRPTFKRATIPTTIPMNAELGADDGAVTVGVTAATAVAATEGTGTWAFAKHAKQIPIKNINIIATLVSRCIGFSFVNYSSVFLGTSKVSVGQRLAVIKLREKIDTFT